MLSTETALQLSKLSSISAYGTVGPGSGRIWLAWVNQELGAECSRRNGGSPFTRK